ncbi:hypothetical protein HDG40_001326 [Paraburkholderia sp. JPY158]|uniref:Uncharacterized protein n=1 Tax=Paraburkholderia atlantica TaxID=2654982 RepID=A0A7W8Q3S0_PARAM|nr:hypothetical protein [Paraburkholderia atlantica]
MYEPAVRSCSARLRKYARHCLGTNIVWIRACRYFALQASLSGWKAHGLAGIERERIRADVAIPDDYAVEAAIAIGRAGDKSSLPEGLQKRESPSPRNPLAAFAAEGQFTFSAPSSRRQGASRRDAPSHGSIRVIR